MKTKTICPILTAFCFGLCSCTLHSRYYNTISRNLDKARADRKISEHDYFASRMQLEAMENQSIQERNARIRMALGGVTANANAQIQANQAADRARSDAMFQQRIRNLNPKTYDSTVTPTYPGGPVHVHTEETGGN